jgi:Predicted ATPase of the ABC class
VFCYGGLGPVASWHPYLDQAASPYFRPAPLANSNSGTLVTLHGLLVKRGITLIVGGGYHGESTLLRCIAAGVYNKIPGDWREFCVTVPDALSIRAEDGRYVNNCNVSAFISNLPTFPLDSIETTESTPALSIGTLAPPPSRTQHFSTGEASGSTSQAANMAEAIELGVTAMLVDEDVSAANFMARDGRMRALVYHIGNFHSRGSGRGGRLVGCAASCSHDGSISLSGRHCQGQVHFEAV